MRSKIFNTDQIRAIQDGRMTQFMQVVKHRISWEGPDCEYGNPEGYAVYDKIGNFYWDNINQQPASLADGFCPFGKVGDVITVRETWVKGITIDENEKPINDDVSKFWYKADNNAPDWYRPELSDDHPNYLTPPWKSPASMPREAARLFLRITNIRVMKAQDLTEEDAKAQGYEVIDDELCPALCALKSDVFEKGLDYIERYHWVIDFEKTDKP